MLADKTLLSVTLATVFASGTCLGFAMQKDRGPGGPPTSAAVIYAPQIEALADQGYDDAELTEAKQAYADYQKGYDVWISQFFEVHRANTDVIDKKLDKRLEVLAARHRERAGAK